ncbi:TRAP transporter small permease subunit [Rhizobium sp. L1K21]|uniref:TRAP transporter small permease subunit n=1 Tax=Rhizobium sp. L1K21 TaxID=2954933 RepID=UPI002093EB4D|nr:TRAP transporter small permease subunit [Rhizobium sp. L1K21]MCO6185597.1 TRAP transporter small permease subunit [Rhizobium sp. L1K21]
MPEFLKTYVRVVEKCNRWIGRATMYLIFVLMGVLLYSSVSKVFFWPANWTLEMAEFIMVAYFIVGGPYSLQLDSHVRMDLLYGRWSPRTKALVDCFTVFLLIAYLIFMLYGGISSTSYALEYGETSYSSWSPYMAPIKIAMVVGIFLMLLQTTAILIKDIAFVKGEAIQ